MNPKPMKGTPRCSAKSWSVRRDGGACSSMPAAHRDSAQLLFTPLHKPPRPSPWLSSWVIITADSQSPQQAVVALTRGSTSSASTDDVAAAACSEVACACAASAGLAPAVAAACPPMLLPPPADATAGRFTRGSTTAGYRQAGSRVGLQWSFCSGFVMIEKPQ